MPFVSAIILNTWAGRKTVACARKLLEQDVPGGLELIVVDNHSQDDSIGYIRNNLPDVRIVETRSNSGFGGGYNAGATYARGTYILINNPDKILSPGSLHRMIETMENDPAIGIIGPKLLHEDGSVRLSPRSFPRFADVFVKRTPLQHLCRKRMTRYLQLDRSPDEERETDWLSGGCILVRKDVFDALQGFDTDFFLFFEDIDFCRRCWNMGKKVLYCPRATAMDRKRRLSEISMFSMPFRAIGRIHIISALRYFWKWKMSPLPRGADLPR